MENSTLLEYDKLLGAIDEMGDTLISMSLIAIIGLRDQLIGMIDDNTKLNLELSKLLAQIAGLRGKKYTEEEIRNLITVNLENVKKIIDTYNTTPTPPITITGGGNNYKIKYKFKDILLGGAVITEIPIIKKLENDNKQSYYDKLESIFIESGNSAIIDKSKTDGSTIPLSDIKLSESQIKLLNTQAAKMSKENIRKLISYRNDCY